MPFTGARICCPPLSLPSVRRAVNPPLYRFPVWTLGLLAGLAVVLSLAFANALVFMWGQWSLDEFSHGYLIPFIAIFLVWQRRDALQRMEFKGSWAGLAVVVLGIALDIAGRLTALFVIQHIALLVMLAGLVLALAGAQAFRVLAAPLAVLVFMIPLPIFLLNNLSSELQLISSSFGVWLMRLAGITVFLEGNVIDLGSYKLEVAEACSGLRYLLPLMTLAFLMACFYRASWWKRTVLFLASIPITLLMNSLRIAAIGLMVDRWGPAMAEGLLHQVQGWMVFMLSIGVLLLVVRLLSRIGRERRAWRELFSLELPAPAPAGVPRQARALPAPLLCAGALVVAFSGAAFLMPAPSGHVPARDSFASFPLQFGGWSGRREAMEPVYLDALKLDDYLMANYLGRDQRPVNFYVAWYDNQVAGNATHSPKGCLPGGGWRIEDFRQTALGQIQIDGQPLRVNRALISYGDQRQLVYYWFQQRGRIVTSEYLVKWYLLVDAVTRHRTDGALVRLIVPISATTSVADADHELQGFIAAIAPRLDRYVPG
jgi:exosortase D (VPLPA-CTERM-specific)